MTPKDDRDWNNCPIGFHVLEELKRCSNQMVKIQETLSQTRVDIGQLKVKSGIWGALGASIPILAGLIVYFITIM